MFVEKEKLEAKFFGEVGEADRGTHRLFGGQF